MGQPCLTLTFLFTAHAVESLSDTSLKSKPTWKSGWAREFLNLPRRGGETGHLRGQEGPLGTALLLATDRTVGLTTLPRDQSYKVARGLKEAHKLAPRYQR